MTATLRRVAMRAPDAIFDADPAVWHYTKTIDADALAAQYHHFVTLVEKAGVEVAWLPAGDDGLADSVFTFDPSFVIVDGNGVVRGDYRYQTLADDADKLIRHTEILAEEIRYADGPAALAYEAAHLFLCYP